MAKSLAFYRLAVESLAKDSPASPSAARITAPTLDRSLQHFEPWGMAPATRTLADRSQYASLVISPIH
ncbi:hypothetical protein D3C78_1749470 [compost metagenome]